MSESQAPSSETPSTRLVEILDDSNRVEELSDSEAEFEDMGPVTKEEEANIAYLDSVRIPIQDSLETATSELQEETLKEVLPYLEGNPNEYPLNIFGIPQLQREKHVAFLKQALKDYPAGFSILDSSRPWILYWSLQGLSALGFDVSEYRERVVHTFSKVQHPEGGYGGGYGQLPHLAATYAAVLSLVIVGGTEAYESIDRKKMWHFLGQMKQTDGGFTMAAGGEEDIRGAFCALVAMSLLHIPLELPPDAPARKYGLTSFTDKLGEWISKCQAFDGGMSAAPGNEAHGAYAFCGLGCLAILGSPKETLNKYLNMSTLIHWLSARQCAPEGGYNGRTNKLVDGCYSHWIGGCWSIVETITAPDIWNRPALTRYILAGCQFKRGGLIDKPGKRADAYHTCYNLAGLSATQHTHSYEEKTKTAISDMSAPFNWKLQGKHRNGKIWDETDTVGAVHPIFVVPFQAVDECREYFLNKVGF